MVYMVLWMVATMFWGFLGSSRWFLRYSGFLRTGLGQSLPQKSTVRAHLSLSVVQTVKELELNVRGLLKPPSVNMNNNNSDA